MNRTALAAPVAVVAVLAAFVLGGGHSASPAAAAADTPSATTGIVVDGLGKVSGTPDVLRVTIGVSVQRADVSSALNAANDAQGKLRKALSRNGVVRADLQTSDVSIYPSYDNHGKRNGYQVSETLTAKLRDIAKSGRAISDAAAAGGNATTVQGVSFALEDNVKLLQRARDAAYADAEAKASQYAKLSGRGLGKVQLVTESTASPQPISYSYDAVKSAQASAPSAVPVDPGTQQVSVSVTVRWSLA